MEQGEIPVVEIGEAEGELDKILGHVVHVGDHVRDAGEDVPIPCLGEAALAEGGGAVNEHGAHLVAVIDGVVEGFLEVLAAQGLVDVEQVGEVLRGFFRHHRLLVGGLRGGHVEDVEHEDGVVGNHGAPGLGNEVRVFHADLVALLGDDLDDVGAVFLDGVVAGGGEVRVGAVVVHRHAAADVEHAHRRAFLDEIAIHADGLRGALADRGDVGDLAALVVVEHFQAGQVAAGLEGIDHANHLRGIEAEHGFIARGFLPVAGSFRGKADADAEIGKHADAAGALQDEVEFAGHFQNEHDLEPHFLGVQGEVDELLVLVAVADDVGLGVVHVREGGDQLGL